MSRPAVISRARFGNSLPDETIVRPNHGNLSPLVRNGTRGPRNDRIDRLRFRMASRRESLRYARLESVAVPGGFAAGITA
jgi:hypothetical protein